VLVLALFIGLTGCDPSVNPMEDTNPPPERPDASSSALSVALLPGDMQQESSETGPAYRCTANVSDPEAEAGYRTYDLALAFPDSVRADSSSENEPAFTELNFTLSLEPTADSTAADSTAADSTAADSTARQTASRVRCSMPPTEDALALMDDRIKADLKAQFGEDEYWFADSDSSAQGNSQSSGQGGAAVSSKYVQDDPNKYCDWNYDNSISTCEYESGPVVRDDPLNDDPVDDTIPIYIPSPPQPDPYTPPGPDDDGSSDPGGGSSPDPTDCSGSLQGPTPESTTAYPASGDVPTWLIPQPDADPASGSDLLDPDYPDNPTPADPEGTGCDDEETSEDEPEEEFEPPCESDNPPEYCDEAGSCYDKDLSGETPEARLDEEIIRGLEDSGELDELWALSNPNDEDQSNRQERGGWIVRSDDGSYRVVSYDEVSSDVVYTPLNTKGVSTADRPSGTVATIHTHPFSPREVITDTSVVRQFIELRGLPIADFDIDEIANPNAGDILRYPSEPSPKDWDRSTDVRMRGYILDRSNILGYSLGDKDGDGRIQEDEASIERHGRCGF
jgi:hypothetical protein